MVSFLLFFPERQLPTLDFIICMCSVMNFYTIYLYYSVMNFTSLYDQKYTTYSSPEVILMQAIPGCWPQTSILTSTVRVAFAWFCILHNALHSYVYFCIFLFNITPVRFIHIVTSVSIFSCWLQHSTVFLNYHHLINLSLV